MHIDIINQENGEKFTVYNVHNDKKKVISEELLDLKRNKVVEILQQPLFFQVMKSLTKIYGENFDIQCFPTFSDSTDINQIKNFTSLQMSIIIKFDEITVTNSRKHIALIKDIFVRFFINFDNKEKQCYLTNGGIDGLRSTMYDFEIESGYLHSHLGSQQNTVPHFGRFCLGSGPISLALISLSKPERFNIVIFEGLLFQIKDYLSWESLEGGPFIKIQNRIRSQNSMIPHNFYCFYRSNYSSVTSLIENILKEHLNNFLKEVKVSYLPEKKDINVELLSSSEEKLINIIRDISKKYSGIDLRVIKTENGYADLNSETVRTPNNTLEGKSVLEFKGKTIPFKVLSENKKTESYSKIVFNPYYKNKMLNYIKYLLKEKIKEDAKTTADSEKNRYYRLKEQESTSIYL